MVGSKSIFRDGLIDFFVTILFLHGFKIPRSPVLIVGTADFRQFYLLKNIVINLLIDK